MYRFTRINFHDHDWKVSFLKELESTKIVIVDISKYSHNVLWEIKSVIQIPGKRLLFPIAIDVKSSRLCCTYYNKKLRESGYRLGLEPLYYPDPESHNFEKKMNTFIIELAKSVSNFFELKSSFKVWIFCFFTFVVYAYSVYFLYAGLLGNPFLQNILALVLLILSPLLIIHPKLKKLGLIK